MSNLSAAFEVGFGLALGALAAVALALGSAVALVRWLAGRR